MESHTSIHSRRNRERQQKRHIPERLTTTARSSPRLFSPQPSASLSLRIQVHHRHIPAPAVHPPAEEILERERGKKGRERRRRRKNERTTTKLQSLEGTTLSRETRACREL
ncbi:hypothetical protein GYH30_033197 [Glycine max]|nr:hypothetical protein GYH30_033197 [Glycine max]